MLAYVMSLPKVHSVQNAGDLKGSTSGSTSAATNASLLYPWQAANHSKPSKDLFRNPKGDGPMMKLMYVMYVHQTE